MLHSWDEVKPPAVKHPADIVAQGRASGQGDGVPSSARTRSGCRETLTSVARDPLSQGPMSQSLLIRHQRPCGRRDLTSSFIVILWDKILQHIPSLLVASEVGLLSSSCGWLTHHPD